MNHFTKKYVIAALNSAEEDDFRKCLKILSNGNYELETNDSYCMVDEPIERKRKTFLKKDDNFTYEDCTFIENKTENQLVPKSKVVLYNSKNCGGKKRGIREYLFDDEKEAYEVAKQYVNEWENLPYCRVEYYPANLCGFLHKEFSKKRLKTLILDDTNIESTNISNIDRYCECKRCYNSATSKKNCFNHELKN